MLKAIALKREIAIKRQCLRDPRHIGVVRNLIHAELFQMIVHELRIKDREPSAVQPRA